jgi:hypothetical protein
MVDDLQASVLQAKQRPSSWKWLLALLLASGATGWTAWSFGFKAGQVAHQAQSAEYACPWHPGVVADKPGKCPVDGMFLLRRQPALLAAARPASPPTSQKLLAYNDLYEALVVDQASAASKAAAALQHLAGDVPEVQKALANFPQELAEQRRRFVGVSEALIREAQRQPNEFNGLHVMRCDMYHARWLQHGGPLRNPYYGDEMLSCGQDLGEPSQVGQP